MTAQEAKKLGYNVIAASAFEVGLVKNGRGIRTWFCRDFDGKLPPLNHPEIQRAIATTEEMLLEEAVARNVLRAGTKKFGTHGGPYRGVLRDAKGKVAWECNHVHTRRDRPVVRHSQWTGNWHEIKRSEEDSAYTCAAKHLEYQIGRAHV